VRGLRREPIIKSTTEASHRQCGLWAGTCRTRLFGRCCWHALPDV